MHHDGSILSIAQKWCTIVVRDCKAVLDWVIIEKMIDYVTDINLINLEFLFYSFFE